MMACVWPARPSARAYPRPGPTAAWARMSLPFAIMHEIAEKSAYQWASGRFWHSRADTVSPDRGLVYAGPVVPAATVAERVLLYAYAVGVFSSSDLRGCRLWDAGGRRARAPSGAFALQPASPSETNGNSYMKEA